MLNSLDASKTLLVKGVPDKKTILHRSASINIFSMAGPSF